MSLEDYKWKYKALKYHIKLHGGMKGGSSLSEFRTAYSAWTSATDTQKSNNTAYTEATKNLKKATDKHTADKDKITKGKERAQCIKAPLKDYGLLEKFSKYLAEIDGTFDESLNDEERTYNDLSKPMEATVTRLKEQLDASVAQSEASRKNAISKYTAMSEDDKLKVTTSELQALDSNLLLQRTKKAAAEQYEKTKKAAAEQASKAASAVGSLFGRRASVEKNIL